MALPLPVERWHAIVASCEPAGLVELLTDDAVFGSRAVHAPQVGRDAVTAYLTGALVVLGPSLPTPVDRWVHRGARVRGDRRRPRRARRRHLHLGQPSTQFTVMVRPLRALEVLVERMGEQLAAPPTRI